VLTDEQQAARMEFSDWWMSAAWPRTHGGETYGFESVDGSAVLRLLRHPKVKWDLHKARSVAQFYLVEKDPFVANQGHPLRILAERVNYYFGKLAQRQFYGDFHVINQRNRPTGSAVGEYESDLPLVVHRPGTGGGDGRDISGPGAAKAAAG